MGEMGSGAPDTDVPAKWVSWLCVAISLGHIYANTLGTWPELYVSAFHFGSFGLLVSLLYPLAPRGRYGQALNAVLGLLALLTAIYLIAAETSLYDRGVRFVATDWVFSIAAIALAIELVRRTAGWIIPILILLALGYVAWWGRYLDGVFHFPGLSLETVLYRSYFGSDGMFGPIARISSTYVFMFILFGAFLVRSGAGEFVIGLARALAGRLIGGPGFIAVIGSALTGTVTGSAVANTVSTGVITIPLMTRAGFAPRFAAGVEAAASTGGQLMPPVMGAGAFIMASYTQIPYLDIIAVAALPALLYFFSVGVFVRIAAKRAGLTPAEDDDRQPAHGLGRRAVAFLAPLAAVVTLLILGFTPTYAAGLSILVVIAASWIGPTPMGARAVIEALALGARNMASTAVLLIAIGLVVNVVATAGIGATFSLMIDQWSGGSLLIAITLVALASLVLGMGLPVTAAYIVLVTLSAPALYELIVHARLIDVLTSAEIPEAAKALLAFVSPDLAARMGSAMTEAQAGALISAVPIELLPTLREQILSPELLTTALLSAHMIIFWLSQDSNVTPPVCLAAFAAAAIAKTPPMATGFSSWKIAKGLYIIPLLFAYTPLLSSDLAEALLIFAFAVPGILALAVALEGYFEAPVGWAARSAYALVGAGLLWPAPLEFKLPVLAVFLALFIANRKKAVNDGLH